MGFLAASDSDGGFCDMEMFCDEFDQGGVGLAVVGFSAKIGEIFAGSGFDEFFLAGAGFNGNGNLRHIDNYIIARHGIISVCGIRSYWQFYRSFGK